MVHCAFLCKSWRSNKRKLQVKSLFFRVKQLFLLILLTWTLFRVIRVIFVNCSASLAEYWNFFRITFEKFEVRTENTLDVKKKVQKKSRSFHDKTSYVCCIFCVEKSNKIIWSKTVLEHKQISKQSLQLKMCYIKQSFRWLLLKEQTATETSYTFHKFQARSSQNLRTYQCIQAHLLLLANTQRRPTSPFVYEAFCTAINSFGALVQSTCLSLVVRIALNCCPQMHVRLQLYVSVSSLCSTEFLYCSALWVKVLGKVTVQ